MWAVRWDPARRIIFVHSPSFRLFLDDPCARPLWFDCPWMELLQLRIILLSSFQFFPYFLSCFWESLHNYLCQFSAFCVNCGLFFDRIPGYSFIAFEFHGCSSYRIERFLNIFSACYCYCGSTVVLLLLCRDVQQEHLLVSISPSPGFREAASSPRCFTPGTWTTLKLYTSVLSLNSLTLGFFTSSKFWSLKILTNGLWSTAMVSDGQPRTNILQLFSPHA